MVSTQDLLVAGGIILAAFVLAQGLSIVFPLLRRAARSTRTKLDDYIIEALLRPLKYLVFFAGVFGALYYVRAELFGLPLRPLMVALGIVLGAYTFLRVFSSLIEWYVHDHARRTKTEMDEHFAPFLRRFVKIAVWVVAAVMVLDNLGIEIGPLLAGLGIAGLAVALALQDSLSNLFSAFYIAADKPVRIGDYVELENGLKGFVEDVGWRSAKIRTLSNNVVVVPNSKLAQSILTNYYAPQQEMSVVVPVGVSYDSDLEKVERVTVAVAKEVQKRVQGAIPEFEPFIRYNKFDESSINFSVILRVKNVVDQYLVTHEFIKRLKKRFDRERIKIPFPQRDVHLRK